MVAPNIIQLSTRIPMVSPTFHGQRRLRTPPDQRQRQGPHAGEGEDDKAGAEIPGQLLSRPPRRAGAVQKFAAVLALDGFVLNFLGAEGTTFHHRLSRQIGPGKGSSPFPMVSAVKAQRTGIVLHHLASFEKASERLASPEPRRKDVWQPCGSGLTGFICRYRMPTA